MDARENAYNPQAIEPAFQAEWEAAQAYRADENNKKPKFYCVSMLPYPSGKLHMGHVRNYTISDVMSRQLRMKGFNVLHPMGWDAFGLPAENAAMKNAVPPAKWTYENIAYMKKQCKAMGWGLDWSREVATCDPAYYKWNQWLFLKMLEKGIAYRKTGVVNWDPVDMTVLANEQVVDGKGWRSGAPVEKREIPMYYLRITDYADELLSQLDKMEGWPAEVRLMQKNWIGKSVGAEIHFPYDEESIGKTGVLKVFSTRPDTIYGATFMAVAAEHPLALQAAQHNAGLAAFIEECKKGGVTEAEMATQEKKGMPTGLFCLHPLTQKKLPIWVGNYVLMGYGEGAVMGVPAHDERDFAFAKKYELRIVQVVESPTVLAYKDAINNGVAFADDPQFKDKVYGKDRELLERELNAIAFTTDKWQSWYSDDGVAIASEDFTGLTTQQFKEKVGAVLQAISLGGPRTTFRLRDWGISRQRYWGTPIPIIHCGDCGPVPVPYEDLPVVLPEDCVPDGSGNPLNKREDFLKCACPKCGKPARRETDTMDTFVDSSWYFMRYACPDAPTMVDARNDHWNPMDQYIGGISHAILHLLYARFWTKVMRDMKGEFPNDPSRGMVKFDEPFKNLLTQGMVLNHVFSRRNDNGGIEYFAPESLNIVLDQHHKVVSATSKIDGQPVNYDGIGTMSKSRLNGVDPQDIVDKYGADASRLFVMFAAPPELTIEWSDAGVEGANRFLNRVWRFVSGVSDVSAKTDWKSADANIRNARMELHKTLAQATFDYGRAQYNTVVSACMKMLNTLEKVPADSPAGAALRAEGTSILLRTLYPVTPHITSALWRDVGYEKLHGSLLDAPWPEVAADALQQDEIELVLQINGKTRGKVTVPAKATREEVEELVRMDETALKYAEGGIKKVIVVPGRLVNVVV